MLEKIDTIEIKESLQKFPHWVKMYAVKDVEIFSDDGKTLFLRIKDKFTLDFKVYIE